MTVQTNIFASCSTVNELEFEYMIRTSPENISWDGERPVEEMRRAIANYQRQYEERLAEIAPHIFH